MQVSNSVAISGKQPTNNLKRKKEILNHQIVFGNEQKQNLQQKEEEKHGFGFKSLTNVLGVGAWLFIVGYSINNLKLINKKHPEAVIRSLKNIKKAGKSYVENAADGDSGNINKALEGVKGKKVVKAFYNLGDKFQNAKMKLGGELFNNLLYAFGTLIVLPAVVLLTPSRKDTSKEDKFFAVLRQPLSVAATLGLQFTFDKMIDKYVPEVLKSNKLEDKSIVDEKGKIKLVDEKGNLLTENLKKIKYNTDSAKDGFKKAVENFLTKDEIKSIFDLRTFEEESADTFNVKLKDVLNQKYEKLGLKLTSVDDIASNDGVIGAFKKQNVKEAKTMEEVLDKFKILSEVFNNKQIAVQKNKTTINVVAASIIGCTFLNVIYGKTMKGLKKLSEDQKQRKNEQAKEVK